MSHTKETAAKVASETVDKTNVLTGKKVEELVKEYSELYTAVLLGLHKDLLAQKARTEESARNSVQIQQQNELRIARLEKLATSKPMQNYLAMAALAVAVAALGVAVWAAM